MIDGVADISQFFPWVVDGTTSHGFAAGLVFLERVLSPESRSKEDDLFGAFDGVPVILYSIRRIGPSEQKRVHLIRRRRKAALRVLVKQGDNELFNTINALVARSKENTK